MQLLSFDQIFRKSDAHRPLIFNGCLWALTFIILLFVFSKGKSPIKTDYYFTISFLVFISMPVLLNFYVLIPKFLKTEKYGLYILSFLLNFGFFTIAFQYVFKSILDGLFPSYFFISYLSETNSYIILSIVLIATTLLKLAEDWFYFNATENRILKLKNTHIETQLTALRAQMNPHFLFNSLNVIYSMAIEKKDDITKAIVELSDILRYVIYDSDTERVTLKQELELLNNFIAFQGYRGLKSEFVELQTTIENNNYKIYPMLLLPLIENSFKYGLSQDNNTERIKISIIQRGKEFYFEIRNKNNYYENGLDKDYSGVGLKTLRDNLNLVYPNTHEFNVEDTSKMFKVTIKIVNED